MISQSQDGYTLVTVASGAASVRCLQTGETFHPVVGPVAEAESLYVKQMRLRERVLAAGGREFVIWDVGLGAGGNALTALRALADTGGEVSIHSFDHTLGPLAFARGRVAELGYPAGFEGAIDDLLNGGLARFRVGKTEVRWTVTVADFPSFLASDAAEGLAKPHAIMFDAFSPARNPAMWTLPLFQRMRSLLDPDRECAMATYSRSTLLRASWLVAGFYVGPGEATGEKEETTFASNSPRLLGTLLDRRWLARARRSTSAEPLVEAVYAQKPLAEATWERLIAHPQFGGVW